MKDLLYLVNMLSWMRRVITGRCEIRIYRDSHVLIVMLKK